MDSHDTLGEALAMDYIPAKHILIRSKSTAWFGTDHTVNLYRGCCHGCLYCDSRSDWYRNPDFDRVTAKSDALRILRDELARKVRPAFIAMGAMSDPYNPFEEELLLTRHALELIDAYDCGVSVDTKSDLIVRDIDLYQSIQAHSPVICKLTVTTVDEDLAAKVEPRAPSPAQRLAAIRSLAQAGLFCGVLLMPVLPFLEDRPEQVLSVVDRSADAGAKFIYSGFGVTMRQGQRGVFSPGAGPGVSGGTSVPAVSGPVRGPVPLPLPPGPGAVGGLCRPMPGAGPAVSDAPHCLGSHPGIWGPAADVF